MRKILVFIIIIVGIMAFTGISFNQKDAASFAVGVYDKTSAALQNSFATVAKLFSSESEDQQPAEEISAAPAIVPEPTAAPTPSPTPPPVPTPTPEPEIEPYTMAWLDKYAPASAASFEEQVGDNGDYSDVTNYPPEDTYKLIVDYTNQCIYAYQKNEFGYYTKLVRVMICTTGGNGNWTPEGRYHLGESRVRFGLFTDYNCYAQYWSQMMGSFYFHSILYSSRDGDSYTMSSYNNLGRPGSHGCIRMLVPDARWLYENCAPGTLCIVTTDFEKDEPLKNALKYGYKGAVDYTGADKEPSGNG